MEDDLGGKIMIEFVELKSENVQLINTRRQ